MKNNLFTILYVITILMIIGVVVTNEYYFQNDVLRSKDENNRLINLANDQPLMVQKIAKSAAAMNYAYGRSEKNYNIAQSEIETSIGEFSKIYEGIRDGSKELGINTKITDSEILTLLENSKFYKSEIENSANSLLFVKFTDGNDGRLKLQRFTNDILVSEKNLTDFTKQMADRFLELSETSVGRYGLLSWVLLGALLVILLIQSLFIFRPTVNLAGKNFLSANKAYQKLKKSEEDLRKSYDSQITVNKELKRSKKQMEIKNAQLEESEKKLLKSTKEQISINEKLLKTQKDLEGAYQKLQNSEQEIRELADKQLEDNEKLFLAEKKMKDLLAKEQAATKNLNDAMERLKGTQSQLVHSEKMASLGQLTAGIAHEINNPINFIYNGISSIKMSLESVKEVLEKYSELEEGADPEELKEDIIELKEDVEYDELLDDLDEILNDVNYGAVRTIEIVKGLRVFSRLDEEESKPALINENIDATLTLLKNKTKNQITISKFYDETLSEIECYPGQLNQVYMNILNNAIQAMPDDRDNPEIQIYTENVDDNTAVIRIKDNGCGIPDEVRERIFEPFFTTKPVGVGTGLGMSISYGIIEKHGGKIELNTEVGKGTEFVITLPKRIDKTKNKEDVYSLKK
ncbi:MAG: ATP-binding protein [Bacteroidota bacterium]